MNKKLGFLTLLLFLPIILSLFITPSVYADEDTFTGETIDGWISYAKAGSYPPDTTGTPTVDTNDAFGRVGQTFTGGIYIVYRSYISFDTSALDDEALVSSAVLQLKTESDESVTDFIVRIYGGTQAIWGNELTVVDWSSGTVLLDSWETVDYVDETYFDFDISAEQINKVGKTQFMIVSDREYTDTTPTGNEFVDFHSGDSTGNEPKLVITYTVESPTGGMKQTVGDNWLFAGEWHEFEATYTYGGDFDTVKLGFSDLYDSNSIYFDGVDDSIDFFGDEFEPPNLDYLTVSIWFQTSADTTGIIDPILATYAWDKGGYVIEIQNNKVGFAVYGGALAYSNDVVNDGEWHYLVGTMDYTTWIYSCYLDGVFQISHAVPVPQRAKIAITAFRLGNTFGSGNLYTGSLDQLSLFDRVLSQSEMDYNMLHYKPQDRLDLVGMWHMDEGAGGTLYDISVYGYTTSMVHGTWQDGNILIDDDHWVIAVYDVTDDVWSLESGNNIVTIQEGSTEQVGEDFIVTYELFFKQSILDRLNVDVYAYSIDTTDNIDYWTEIATDYFNIYNLGGFATLETDNDAGRIEGGDVFDLYADGVDAWVRVNQTYRKIQHVKVQAGFVIKDPNDYGDVYVRYGIDFIDPTTKLFIKGWNVLINVTAIDVTNAAYCVLEVRWYFNDVQIGTTDTMYSMWEDQAFMTPDGEYSGTRFHLDLWFNKVNGSSVVGGRVAPFMYGLTKDDPPWWLWWNWWGAGEWKPMRVNTTDSFLFTNLQDYTGETITSKALDLTRFWCNLTNVGANDDIYVMNYRVFDYTFASGEMEGINTPPFPETLDPELPAGGGILGGLFSALKGLAQTIGNVLTSGIVSLWSTFVSALDMIFSFAGWSNGFSVILSWIQSFLSWMVDGIGYAISLLVSTFQLMANWLSFAIGRFTVIATGFVNIYNVLVDIWTQANAGWLSITSWLTPMLPLLPLAIFIWIFSARDTEGFIRRIMMLWGLLRSTIGFLIQIGQFVISTIYGLIELVPVAE